MSSQDETLNQPETDHERGKAEMGGIAAFVIIGFALCKYAAGCHTATPAEAARNMLHQDSSKAKMVTMNSAPTVK